MSEKASIIEFLKTLRTEIIERFQTLEPVAKFERKEWAYTRGEGGGEISQIRGDVFEKAAVNWSAVSGAKFPGSDASGAFFATGLSLITHMKNPKAPTVHFNIRYIEASDKKWLGGGFDLTPMGFEFSDDTTHFHKVAAQILNPWPGRYDEFSKNAKDYFFIKHYGRERGVGGIFFDHFHSTDWNDDLRMWKAVGSGFLESVMPIYSRRISEPYSSSDREIQLLKRAHYVEFNLLYDRGTRFGFESGGNPEAILCSMPPLAAW
jgi:coproporphyrinogen III oxidase